MKRVAFVRGGKRLPRQISLFLEQAILCNQPTSSPDCWMIFRCEVANGKPLRFTRTGEQGVWPLCLSHQKLGDLQAQVLCSAVPLSPPAACRGPHKVSIFHSATCGQICVCACAGGERSGVWLSPAFSFTSLHVKQTSRSFISGLIPWFPEFWFNLKIF